MTYKKNMLNNLLCFSFILMIINFIIYRFTGGYIIKFFNILFIPIVLILGGCRTKSLSEKNKRIISKTSFYAFILVSFGKYFVKIFGGEFVNFEYIFSSESWYVAFLLAIPIYIFLSGKIKNIESFIRIIIFMIVLSMVDVFRFSLINNVIYFMPFFIFGYCFDDIYTKIMKNKWDWVLFIFLGIISGVFYFANQFIYDVGAALKDVYTYIFVLDKICLYIIPTVVFLILYFILNKIQVLDYDLKISKLYNKCIDFIESKKSKKDYEESENLLVKIINSGYLLIIFILIIFFKISLFNFNIGIEKFSIDLGIDSYNLLFFIVLIVPVILVKNPKLRYILVFVYDLLFSAVLFANELYFSYSNLALSLNQIYNAKYVTEIANVGVNLLKIHQILYFIDLILMVVVFVKFRKKFNGAKINLLTNVIISVFIMFVCISDCNSILNLINNTNFDPAYQLSTFGIVGYHTQDALNFMNKKRNLMYKNEDELGQAYNKIVDRNSGYNVSYVGETNQQNVIILQLEAIQEFLYGARINGEEITPNLNRFLDENVHLTNLHAQSYTTTADSEFSSITSLYCLDNGLSFSKYFSVDYNNLYSDLNDKGYYTLFMHGNNGEYWNRKRVYNNFGVDEMMFIDSFEEKESVMWYLSDEILYREGVEKLNEIQEPFMVNLVAASSHTPFTLLGLDKSVLTIDVGDEYRDTMFGNYLEAANYADIQFGYFIELLKENNLYDNSIVFVYGDHYGMTADDEDMLRYFSENGNSLNDTQKIINFTNCLAGIHIPGVSSQIIDKPTSKIDVRPTVLSLLGINDGDYTLGTSVFSDKNYVCLKEGTIITDKYYYSSEKWYDIVSGNEIDFIDLDEDVQEELNRIVDYSRIEIEISKAYPILNK